jgi:carboxyl-terminal processing protease
MVKSVAILLIFVFGYMIGQGGFGFAGNQVVVNRAYDKQRADYSLFWSAYDTLMEKFADQPLNQQELLYGAIHGMVGAAGDPYTVFFDPEEAEQFAQELQGSFDGIGAEIGIKNDQLVVVAPLDNTPAQRAGLLPGDIIVAIDDETTTGITVDSAVSKIRGQAGTEVKLTILHEGNSTPQDVVIVRAKIEVRSMEFEIKDVADKSIAVIKLSRFGEDTQGLFNHAVDVILQSGVDGIVLDLRSNPGGYLETAVAVASNWVETDKVVVKQKSNNGLVEEYVSEAWPRLNGIKTVVLVNGGSASASEIVAGALQDYSLATLIGEKTFGKGSVQELIDMKDGSTIKVTTAKWLTPNDRTIDKNGLEPNEVVEQTREQYLNGQDPQMDQALEILK